MTSTSTFTDTSPELDVSRCMAADSHRQADWTKEMSDIHTQAAAHNIQWLWQFIAALTFWTPFSDRLTSCQTFCTQCFFNLFKLPFWLEYILWFVNANFQCRFEFNTDFKAWFIADASGRTDTSARARARARVCVCVYVCVYACVSAWIRVSNLYDAKCGFIYRGLYLHWLKLGIFVLQGS